jgi:NADPH:quinone reductase
MLFWSWAHQVLLDLLLVNWAGEIGCKVLKGSRRDTADINLARDPEMKTVKSVTGGKGPDVIIDTTGSLDLMKGGLQCLAPRGRLAYISAPRVGSTDCSFDMKHIYREEKTLIGCNSVLSRLTDTAKDLAAMRLGFESGKFRVVEEEKLKKISIENAVDAYNSTKTSSSKKIVIVFE